MTGFLDLPLELRNYVYDLLLCEDLEPQFRGVMVVSEKYVKMDLPVLRYRGILRVCRQVYSEFKQAIQHLAVSKQLNYAFDIMFSHGRPFFSLTWNRFPSLSRVVNHLFINVDLRTREPFRDNPNTPSIPNDHELTHLLEDSPESFAGQLFDYIAILLKTLATLLSYGDATFSVLYTEIVTLNFRTPTKVVVPEGLNLSLLDQSHRTLVDQSEARSLHDRMRNTLRATSKGFKAFNASECDNLFPLIQIGSLRFAKEGELWGEGHNLVLAHDDFQWLRY